MARLIFEGPRAEDRLSRAASWLSERAERRVTVVGASSDAAAEVARRALKTASFGWQRMTLGALAVSIARAELAKEGLCPAFGLSLEAVCARVVHASRGKFSRLAPIEDRPGLPRALARTVTELRLAGNPKPADADLAKLSKAFDAELGKAGLADRAQIFALATKLLSDKKVKAEVGPIAFVDVPVRTRAERDFVAALSGDEVLVVTPTGDARSRALYEAALGVEASTAPADTTTALGRLQAELFGESGDRSEQSREGVDILSAPGESRESVEIARIVLAEAQRGTPLDRMAVLLRAPAYAAHLEEAFRRAKIPCYFARGTRQPDPAGRALLALVGCAAEGLSARRFSEYLSLGEVPEETKEGGPPPPIPHGDRVATPDEEALAALLAPVTIEEPKEEDEKKPALAEEDRASAFGTLRTPRHWEKLLVEAAVIGEKKRWVDRLDGLRAKLEADRDAWQAKAEDNMAENVSRDLATLENLRRFALPLIDDLDEFPQTAMWGEWIEKLKKLSTRAIRHHERVLAVLGELEPMAKVGPVDITEVRLVLERRLSQLVVPPSGRRYGKLYIATIDEARGLSFDVVFVPGLAEKIFPQKVVEDPLLLDDAREKLKADLPTNAQRTDDERLALRLAVGAAERRVVMSYPRLDVEQARPRTPSFYGLEVLRVAEGVLRGFEYLQDTAGKQTDARIGWPAPKDRDDAIDEAEYDLALLESLQKKPENECVGEAHYLLNANEHLARALRFRGRRWLRVWKSADGLVDPPPEALLAIRAHGLANRSFSPTALQNYATCPYKFLLSAVHKLAPREELEPVEELDPLTRGSLVHEVQFHLLSELRQRSMLPITKPRLEDAYVVLGEQLERIAQMEHDRLKPAIERVWKDAIEGIAVDLREWLRRMTDPGELEWTPTFFELSFGLKERRDADAVSKDDPVSLDVGIQLRGSIDLVEKSDKGVIRATDYKTGKVRAKDGDIIKKGELLQPVLYALVLEKLFPKSKIDGGRLYYCTAAGEFTPVHVPLDDEAKKAARVMATAVGGALEAGFLPAAPAKDACRYCDFKSVCGPYEEIRTKRKPADRLKPLTELRKQR